MRLYDIPQGTVAVKRNGHGTEVVLTGTETVAVPGLDGCVEPVHVRSFYFDKHGNPAFSYEKDGETLWHSGLTEGMDDDIIDALRETMDESDKRAIGMCDRARHGTYFSEILERVVGAFL